MSGILIPVSLNNLYTRLFNTFDEARGGGTISSELVTKLALTVPSSTRYNTYAWLDSFPRMREWIGQRAVRGLTQRSYQIYNKDYEITYGVDRDSLDDAQLIDAQVYVRMMAEAAKQLPLDLVVDLLRNGQSRVGYDGQTFFNPNHPTSIDNVTGSQSNYLTGMPLNRANYVTARAAMMSWLGADLRPYGVWPDLLIVPPQLTEAANSIVLTQNYAIAGVGMQTNTLINSAQVMTVPELAVDPTTWYLVSTAGALKPFIIQERQAPRFVSRTAPNETNMFWSKTYEFGADARYGAGYGAWWKLLKAVA